MDANILCFSKLLTCAPVTDAVAVYLFVQVTGGTGEETPHQNLLAEILRKSSKFLKAWESNAMAEAVRTSHGDAMGLPGQSMQLQPEMGLAVDSLALSLRSLLPLERAPPALCPQGDGAVAAAPRAHRRTSDDLTSAATPSEGGALSPA